jgi:dTMP kinase
MFEDGMFEGFWGNAPVSRALEAAESSETRMDEQSLDFHRRVRDAYHALAVQEPGRIRLVNGASDAETIAAEIWKIVSRHV